MIKPDLLKKVPSKATTLCRSGPPNAKRFASSTPSQTRVSLHGTSSRSLLICSAQHSRFRNVAGTRNIPQPPALRVARIQLSAA